MKKKCVCKDPNGYDYDVTACVRLVRHGYQIDIFMDGKEAGTICRDFGDSWPIKKMQEVVAATLFNAMQDVESNARKLKNASRKVQKRQQKISTRSPVKTV